MKIEYDYDYWKDKGHEAGNTTKISEKFCAGHIKKLKAKKNIHFSFFDEKCFSKDFEKEIRFF